MPGASASRFHTTRWSLVLAAADRPTADSRQALAKLCEIYWHPVYAFIRRSGYDLEQAQDLTQGFFTLLIEKNYLQAADRQRGRFRSFLLTAVKHFLANEWDRGNALKRGGGQVRVPLDSLDLERWYKPTAVNEVTPEVLFDRRWALSLLDHVMAKLRAAYTTSGKAEHFEVLSSFLNRNSDDPRYEEVASSSGMSAGGLRMAVLRMRRKYRALLRAEIAETVASPEEIDDEIRFLLSVLNA
jgi:DNA-directed RNA polymerase specialized sigma24 family protein